MAVAYADSLKQSPWYVRSTASEKYFNKHIKPKADKLDALLDDNAQDTLNQLWEQFRKKPSTLPVYTKQQFNQMVAKPDLTDKDKLVLHRFLARNPKMFFLSSELLKKSHETATLIANSFNKFIARILRLVKKEKTVFSIQLQDAHKYIAANHWGAVDPKNSFMARWFSRFQFVQRRIIAKQKRLITLSPYYCAKIKGMSMIGLLEKHPNYCAKFGLTLTVTATKDIEFVTTITAFMDVENDPVVTTTPAPAKQFKPIKVEVTNTTAQPHLVPTVSVPPMATENVVQIIEPKKSQVATVIIAQPNEPKPQTTTTVAQRLKQQPKEQPTPECERIVYAAKTKAFDWDPSKKSLTKFAKEVLTKENRNVNAQFERDVDLMTKTLRAPGSDDFHGALSASVLKKLLYTFNATDPMYRRDKMWHRFSESDIPLAGLFGHSTRTLIQLPPVDVDGTDYAQDFLVNFLGIGKEHKRAAATHGVLVMPKHEFVNDGIYKHIEEVKPGKVESGVNLVYDYFNPDSLEGHYGINLAFGGAGNKHFLSGKIIDNKGEHGHLYIYFKPATKTTPGAFLVGIEGSAPSDKAAADVQNFVGSVYDHVGGGHDILGTPSRFCVSGGEKMGKSAESMDGRGPDEYYDSMFVHLSVEQFQLIQDQFNEEQFDDSLLRSPPSGHEKETGHDAMEELFKAHPVDCSADQSSLWCYYNYLFSSNEQIDDNVFNAQWHLDIVDGKKLQGISSIDEGYQKSVIQLAIKELSGYLQLDGKKIENKNLVEKLIEDLSRINTWKELIAYLYRLETITVHTGDRAHSMGEFILQKPDSKLLPAENVSDSMMANSPNDPMIHSIVGGFKEMVFEYNHFQKFVVDAHQILMQLIPTQCHQLQAHNMSDIEEIKQWKKEVTTILPGQEFKAMRDFARDFAINGVDGKQRITQINMAPENEAVEAADKERMLQKDVISSVESVIDIMDPDFEAKKNFILSSGSQDMTRFVEQLIYNHLEIDGRSGLRIANSEQHGNWYLDDDNNTCFNAKIYVTSLMDPATFKYVTAQNGIVQMVDPSEQLSKATKAHQLPKMLEVDVQIRLDIERVQQQEALVVPVVEQCTFNFYNKAIRLDKTLEKDIANDFVVLSQ